MRVVSLRLIQADEADWLGLEGFVNGTGVEETDVGVTVAGVGVLFSVMLSAVVEFLAAEEDMLRVRVA